MRTLIAGLVLALTLATAAVAQPRPTDLAGTWRSLDDAKSVVTIKADGAWIDVYDGQTMGPHSQWAMFSGAKPPKDAAGQVFEPSQTYLAVRSDMPLFYSVDRLDPKALELTYLGRGNLLRYARLK